MASVLQYFNYKRAKPVQDEADKKEPDRPVLKEEDEKFLERITTSTEEPPPLPRRTTIISDDGKVIRGKDAQIALMDGANNIPLPQSPGEDGDTASEDSGDESVKDGSEGVAKKAKKPVNYWTYVPAVPWRLKNKDKSQAADGLQAAINASKTGEVEKEAEEAADKERDHAELTAVLDNLNLSAINNRVFSISKESQELLDKFNLVLKDIINGVPTAYDDLEHLLTNSEGQLDKMFGSMPPFLQTLVKSLPARMTSTLGPQILAAASEKAGVDAAAVPGLKAKRSEGEGDAEATGKKKTKSRMPSLKSLVTEQGSVAMMLRSILNYLKLRFPAFITGTNVLMSLAVSVLLLVFWYCHKRGRETRLSKEEKERMGVEGSVSDGEDTTVQETPKEDPRATSKSADIDANTATQEAPTDAPAEPKPDNHETKSEKQQQQEQPSTKDAQAILDLPEPAQVPLSKPDQLETKNLQNEPTETKPKM